MLINTVLSFVLTANLNYVADNPEQAFIDPQADVPVVVEAPYNAWGIRPVIRDAKTELGLDIVFRRGVTCSRFSERRCLKVHVGEYNWQWHGQYLYGDGYHDIYLNEGYARVYNGYFKQETAAHEFGHFLGFSHHKSYEGIMGVYWNIYNRPSQEEYRVLREYYVR